MSYHKICQKFTLLALLSAITFSLSGACYASNNENLNRPSRPIHKISGLPEVYQEGAQLTVEQMKKIYALNIGDEFSIFGKTAKITAKEPGKDLDNLFRTPGEVTLNTTNNVNTGDGYSYIRYLVLQGVKETPSKLTQLLKFEIGSLLKK